jgi:gliding motility-associated-like protein
LANFLENPPGNYTYWWQPIGATSATLSVKHPGIYSLRIKNEEGCSTTEAVRVHKDCMMDIPNAFTPNQDGINDYFFPRQWLNSDLEFFSMQIFNSWGQMIFETNEERGRGWDGQYNGKDQPTGVYVYRIKAIFRDNRVEQLEGNVTLIR